MKKFNLKKKVISVLTDQEKNSINGGLNAGGAGTTSFTNCSGVLCCNPQPCLPASEGVGATCLLACPAVSKYC